MPETHLSPSEAQDELRAAYYAGNIERISQLFANAPLDAEDATLALEGSLMEMDPALIRVLLQNGADISSITCRDIPRSGQVSELLELLAQHNYDFKTDGRRILQSAVSLIHEQDGTNRYQRFCSRSKDARLVVVVTVARHVPEVEEEVYTLGASDTVSPRTIRHGHSSHDSIIMINVAHNKLKHSSSTLSSKCGPFFKLSRRFRLDRPRIGLHKRSKVLCHVTSCMTRKLSYSKQ
jgi:hypothetical protein